MRKGAYTSRRGESAHKLNPQNASFALEFKRAAQAFTLKATRSPEKARAILVEAGILTQRGTLSKNYR